MAKHSTTGGELGLFGLRRVAFVEYLVERKVLRHKICTIFVW